jgi:hypothetical protein
MKLNRTTAVTGVLALALAASGCNDGLTDMNRNPNVPEDVPASLLLSPLLWRSAGSVAGVNINYYSSGIWAQHISQIQYADEDAFTLRTDRIQGQWDAWYLLQRNIGEMIQKGEEAPVSANAVGIGLVMRSFNFGVMTDLWGDLPYSQALQGDAGVWSPAYDTQQQVYDGIFADLRRAHDIISVADGGFGARDLVYGGNMENWRRFANSLRMRHAMRLTSADPAKARSEFEAAIATGAYIESNAQDARVVYLLGSPNQHPLYVNALTRDDVRISETLVEWLEERSDPRLPVYAQPAQSDGAFRGYPNGLPDNSFPLESRSKLGTAFLAANAPAVFISNSEVLFLRAEAAHRGWNAGGGSAQELYEAAITANLQRLGLSAAAIADYLAHPLVAWDAANATQLIAEQKWASLYLQGAEAFSEWRRTGYPVLTPGPVPVSLGRTQNPRRYFYPPMEHALNSANLSVAVTRQGDADLWGRVWWDQ